MKYILSLMLVASIVYGSMHYWNTKAQHISQFNAHEGDVEEMLQGPVFTIVEEEIIAGDTYGVLMERVGVSGTVSRAIATVVDDVYNLARIVAGRSFILYFDSEEELQKIIYPVDAVSELIVERVYDEWVAAVVPIEYDIEVVEQEGVVTSSLYYAALEAGIDERVVISLANVFQWTLDFSMDVREGDTFKVVYEKRYRNGEYVRPGKIIAAEFVNMNKSYKGFYFEEEEGKFGYFNEEGDSLQTVFLKAPVEYRYISSGFTTGQRYVAAFNTSTGHRAIDYAAPTGTPIRAVGDGTIVRAGWNGMYGNFIAIRHNSTYTTNYAHLSKINVRVGDKVSQGHIIGLVGSTGFSTGPHLHYEMVKNGVKINPLTEQFPASEGISEDLKPRYFNEIREWADRIGVHIPQDEEENIQEEE